MFNRLEIHVCLVRYIITARISIESVTVTVILIIFMLEACIRYGTLKFVFCKIWRYTRNTKWKFQWFYISAICGEYQWSLRSGHFNLGTNLVGIVRVEVQLVPLCKSAINCASLLCQPRVIMMTEKLVEWLARETEVLRENLPQYRKHGG
jgi:hypothetical protein